jgi:hypothetical protein
MNSPSYFPTKFSPPGSGQGSHDQWKDSMPPVDFQLERLYTYIDWSRGTLAAFHIQRESNPELAEMELKYLEGDLNSAIAHLTRLHELLVAGYQATPIPHPKFGRGQTVRIILQEGDKKDKNGTVGSILWNCKNQCYHYYVKENDDDVSKGYSENDLEAIS